MITTTVWPSSWNMRSVSRTTRWPTCRSGAVGSRPSLTRSLSPRSSRALRCASTWTSTARSRRRSNRLTFAPALGDWIGAEVRLGVGGQQRCEQGDDRPAGRVDQADHVDRVLDRVAQVLLQWIEYHAADGVRRGA